MPVPDPRPSEKIAKLFPQVDPLKEAQKDQKNGVTTSDVSAVSNPKGAASVAEPVKNAAPAPPPAVAAQAAAGKVPLPEARPVIKPGREMRRHRRVSQYRRNR
jgi:membrane-bound lytic murein transglycosylase A